ncbi:hypothetical protein [Peptostreptococcus equinus]|uniref:hypothetical protein n=1 Tax=Peptostreptococcus equinus TaxID=3003601 RepID=UPI003BF593C8
MESIKFSHGLRKMYTINIFEKNIPSKTVQVLMGHPYITITLNLYTEVMGNQK